jgi:hypothetical protein
MSLPPRIEALRDPRRYAHPVTQVEVVETHISWLLLAGEFAYKFKKPVTLPFLDYGTVAQRRACCEAELRLNRRYAPDLYLAVVEFDGEPAVQMRRFDETGRLDHVSARGELSAAHLSALARTIADFHAGAALAAADGRFGAPAQVLAAAMENFAELDALLPAAAPRLQALRQWTGEEFARCRATFAERRRAGRIRECHGDLHLGNLVLIDGEVTPFDCIEFNEDLRWIDVASEIAFTYVDLLDHGKPGLAGWLINEWLVWSGDFAALAVLRFYAVYRAMVRAKVAALRGAIAEADDYLALAGRLVAPPRPALTITCGLSGSGKTTATTARLLGDEAAATIRVRSDVERKRLFGLAADAASGGAIYGAAATQQTYDRLAELAECCLVAGWSAIVDAAFLRRAERERFRHLAEAAGVPFAILFCAAPVDELRRRLAGRVGDASEATDAVLEQQLDWLEPLTAAEQGLLSSPAT